MEKKCEQEANKGSVECLQWRALRILRKSGDNKAEIKKALKLLEQAQSISPTDLSILTKIGGCYLQMKDYKTALVYFDQVLAIDPAFISVRFFKCMLLERIDYTEKKYRSCYRSVVRWYQNRGKTKDVDYVYAVLMLGTPDAEKIKNEYLASLEPGSEQAKMWNELLKDFDREKYLRQILP